MSCPCVAPTYTSPVNQTKTLKMDFVIHGAGLAGPQNKKGRRSLHSPPRAYQPDPTADWHLLSVMKRHPRYRGSPGDARRRWSRARGCYRRPRNRPPHQALKSLVGRGPFTLTVIEGERGSVAWSRPGFAHGEQKPCASTNEERKRADIAIGLLGLWSRRRCFPGRKRNCPSARFTLRLLQY